MQEYEVSVVRIVTRACCGKRKWLILEANSTFINPYQIDQDLECKLSSVINHATVDLKCSLK